MVLKVTLVCIGRFHIFDLARELYKHGVLEKIFTGYPRWKAKGWEIPLEKFDTFPWIQVPFMALGKWGVLKDGRLRQTIAWFSHAMLDRYVAGRLPECDVLFVLSGSGVECGKVAKRRGIKYICDRGSSHIRYQNRILSEEFARWGEKFPGIIPRMIEREEMEYETADVIIVPSTFAYRTFVEMGVPKEKLRKVPYGVDLRLFSKVADPDPDAFDVLFVGGISFRKGVPYLLEAFKKVRHPKKRLRLVGGIGPEMARFFKRNPPGDKVEILGHKLQRELKEIMSRSHVMVLPSIEEGLALVQGQALACGCPVIGTYHTGAEDLFSHGVEGFIVPPRDPDAIAEKLQELADDPDLRQRMSEAALKRVRELGGWEDYGRRMLRVFEELCD